LKNDILRRLADVSRFLIGLVHGSFGSPPCNTRLDHNNPHPIKLHQVSLNCLFFFPQ
jgi:hypothetical protein